MTQNQDPNGGQSTTEGGNNSQTGTDYQKLYTDLKAKVDSGELVKGAIEEKVKAAELFTKEAYTGLQKSVDKKHGELLTAQQELANLKPQLQTVGTQLSTLEQEKKTLAEKNEADQLELAKLNADKTRLSLIVTKFPDLASFEAEGLLPDAADATELESLLSKFAEKVGVIKTAAKKEFGKGGLPQNPPAGNGKIGGTANEFLQKANAAGRVGNRAEYDANFAKYLELSANNE